LIKQKPVANAFNYGDDSSRSKERGSRLDRMGRRTSRNNRSRLGKATQDQVVYEISTKSRRKKKSFTKRKGEKGAREKGGGNEGKKEEEGSKPRSCNARRLIAQPLVGG